MTKRPDVYTTLGQERGCCGHPHPTVQAAVAALGLSSEAASVN